jgi:hypothetical protein
MNETRQVALDELADLRKRFYERAGDTSLSAQRERETDLWRAIEVATYFARNAKGAP